MPEVAIGVTTYNGASRAGNLFHSIGQRTPKSIDWQVVLVDDGSPNVHQTRELAKLWKDSLRLTYIEHGRNRGISAGWNTAARALDCKYVVLINDDVIVSKGWLESLVFALEHSPQVGVVGMSWHAFVLGDVHQLIKEPDSDLYAAPRDPLSKVEDLNRRGFEDCNPGRVMAPTGQLFAFRRADFDRLGGFDENYLSFYEETDFGTALARDGKIGLQINWPHCWHMWSATFTASPELQAEQRRLASHTHYCKKWNIPGEFFNHPFDFTNPTYLGAVGDVPVEFLKKDGSVGRGVLRKDGAYIANS